MILTEKAKEDFLSYINFIEHNVTYECTERGEFVWLGNEINLLYGNKLMFHSLVIEWFDNVGITVDVLPGVEDSKLIFSPNTFCLEQDIITEDFIYFKTRQEAIESAIIKANEIYNQSS